MAMGQLQILLGELIQCEKVYENSLRTIGTSRRCIYKNIQDGTSSFGMKEELNKEHQMSGTNPQDIHSNIFNQAIQSL